LFFCTKILCLTYTIVGDVMSKDSFKSFVRTKPGLIKYVNNNETTWQKLYEMYELYGENSEVWNKYNESASSVVANKIISGESSIKELIGMVKDMDMDKVRQGIEGVQKAIGLIQDLGIGNKNSAENMYRARPIYRHFDD